MDSFRQRLEEFAATISDGGTEKSACADVIEGNENDKSTFSKYPLVFIIDELDRCRPTFAVNIIERIKHLFSVPGVTFVLVTNIHQLSAAVKGVYGQETDGNLYLEKFYDIRVKLPTNIAIHQSFHEIYINYLWRNMGIDSGDAKSNETARRELTILGNIHDLSLRTLERVVTHVALAFAASGPKGLKIAPFIAGLAVI